MNLIRPNGLVERLWFGQRQQVELKHYGRVQLGPATAETPPRRSAGPAAEAPAPARSLARPRRRPDRLTEVPGRAPGRRRPERRAHGQAGPALLTVGGSSGRAPPHELTPPAPEVMLAAYHAHLARRIRYFGPLMPVDLRV